MLDKVKAGYFNLLKHPPLLEHPIRMAVIAPLLFFADFFLSPFHIRYETTVTLEGGCGQKQLVRGRPGVVKNSWYTGDPRGVLRRSIRIGHL